MESPFCDGQLMVAYDYWRSIRGDRAAPQRADLDLRVMRELLPRFNLLDVHWEPLRFRHRLVGSHYVEVLGRDVTGRFVDEELYGEAASEIFENLKMVAVEVRPYRRMARLEWLGRKGLMIESAELPLVDEDDRVNMILRVSSFSPTVDIETPRLSYLPLE